MRLIEKKYGLIGKNIAYSFSKGYFTDKFVKNNLTNCSYHNFDIQEIFELKKILKKNRDLKGLNVTIPYKEAIIPYLDQLSYDILEIGAVNVIRFTAKRKLKGYNTDHYGFRKALQPLLQPHHKKALILGTGGASKGVAFALKKLDIPFTFVSRVASKNALDYESIDATVFEEYQIIINCTPLGTSPKTDECPSIPYENFSPQHLAFDLIYNPAETLFLQKARENGALTENGLRMLHFQAEKAWKIWNK